MHHEYIGKESNAVDMEIELNAGGMITIPYREALHSTGIGTAIKAFGVKALSELSGIPVNTLYAITKKAGARPDKGTLKVILEAMNGDSFSQVA
jgi:hypothetical protein